MSAHGNDPPTVSKLFYRIGEVASIVGVDTSVIRHWESEFRVLRPQRSKSGHRVFSTSDVRKLLEIKRLLHEEHFTIKGAVKHLRHKGVEPRPSDDPVLTANARYRQALADVKRDLVELVASLEQEESDE